MSVKVSAWVWHDVPDLKHGELIVLTALADVADDNGICRYLDEENDSTQDAWAKKCRMSERGFRRVLAQLQERELVTVQRDGRTSTNRYSVNVPWGIARGQIGLSREDASVLSERTPVSSRSSLLRSDVIKAPSKGSRMTTDWSPTTADLDFLITNGPSLDVTIEVAQFRDYWLSVPGQRGLKLDWSATWRSHVRRQHGWNVERGWKPAQVAAATRWEFES